MPTKLVFNDDGTVSFTGMFQARAQDEEYDPSFEVKKYGKRVVDIHSVVSIVNTFWKELVGIYPNVLNKVVVSFQNARQSDATPTIIRFSYQSLLLHFLHGYKEYESLRELARIYPFMEHPGSTSVEVLVMHEASHAIAFHLASGCDPHGAIFIHVYSSLLQWYSKRNK